VELDVPGSLQADPQQAPRRDPKAPAVRDHAERPGTSIVASQDLVEHGPHPLACRLERLTAWRRPPGGAATPRGIAHRVVHLQLCVRAAFPLPLAELHETAVGLHRDIVTA